VKFVVLAAATALAMGFVQAAAAQSRTLRYGQAYSSAHTVFSLPLAVAQREGLFGREGLDVEVVIPVPGGVDKMIDALHDDWADVAHVATPFLIRAAMAGSDAVAIDAEFANPVYSLIAQPEIGTFADLKTKVVGLADEAGTITMSMRKLLAARGLQRGSFVTTIEAGTPTRWNCLRNRNCDAVVLGQPQDLEAIAQGYRLLGRSTDVVPDLLYTVTAARRSWAQAHSDMVVRFVRAMAAACAFIHDPERRDEVVKIISETTNSSDVIAAQTLQLLLQPASRVLPERAEINLTGLNAVIAMMGEAGLLEAPLPRAERFVDLQYLRAAGVQ
jgi:ABC-type nitrate/sulfonate/bicarbonate transport system substrate-binding protein